MASYRVLYWQEVPAQIKAEDEFDEVNLPLSMSERIDQLAVELGLVGGDDYLAQWHWGEEQQRPGAAREVAEAVKVELEAQAGSSGK
jgi:hypothetical protein